MLIFIVCCGVIFTKKKEPFSETCSTIYVIRAHIMDDQLQQMYERMTKELGDCVYILFDNTQKGMTEEFLKKYSGRVILMTEDEARTVNPLHTSNWANGDTALGILYREFKDKHFDYLWLIESDVYCDGSWGAVFEQIRDMKQDFLATIIEDYNETNSGWPHWNALVNYHVPLPSQTKCFFPFTRYSNAFMKVIHDNIGKHSGYCEVYLPTLARNNSFTFANVPDHIIGKFDFVKVTVPFKNDNRIYHKVVDMK
jgi:hypothetical protein